MLPQEHLVSVDGSPAEYLVEAWDYQKYGKDRLIGRAVVKMADVHKGKVTVPLQPTTLADKQDAADIFYMVLGCGATSNAGSITFELAPEQGAAAAAAVRDTKRFDVDDQLLKNDAHEAASGVEWQSLAERRAAFMADMQAGEEVFEKSILTGILRTYRDVTNYISVAFGAKLFAYVRRYSPFYQSQLSAGAEFGSATKALFIFMSSVIVSNLIQFIVWLPTWIGQLLFVSDINPLSEFLLAVFATKAEEEGSLGTDEIDTSGGGLTFNLTEPAGFLFFSGYQPQTFISKDDATGEESYYPTGMWYVACGFITLLSTLFVYTVRVSEQIRHPSIAVSSSSPLPPGTSSILNALFGGWDYTHYSKDATSKIRREIVTVIKEGEADAERASQKTTVVVTKAERNKLFAKRIVLMLIALVLTAGGSMIITFCLAPSALRDQVLKKLAAAVPVIGPLADTLIVTMINAVVPTLIRMLVQMEQWSPAVELRQTLARVFFVKVVNATAVFVNLGLLQEADKALSDRTCVEKVAAETYVSLLFSDFLVVALGFTLPKYLTLTLIPTIKYKLAMSKQPKTAAAPEPPPSPPPSPAWGFLTPAQEATEEEAAPHSVSPADPPPPEPSPSPPDDEPSTGDAKTPSGPPLKPQTGYMHPKAPKLDLIKEVMEIIYRQILLFTGMIISPWLFLIGFASNFCLYWIKYQAVMAFHKRPKELKEYFGAGDTVRDFYLFMLLAVCFSWIPYLVYVTLPVNPICGPLRSPQCAAEFAEGNFSSCLIDLAEKRTNIKVLADNLLPPAGTEISLGSFGLSLNGTTPVEDETETCGAECLAKNAVGLFVSLPVLILTVLTLIVSMCFSTASNLRVKRELGEARRELSIEYTDKKMMLRWANVEI